MDEASVNTAHLFSRAGFGGLREEIELYKSWAWGDLVDLVLDTGRAPSPPAAPDLSPHLGYSDRYTRIQNYWLDQARRPVDQAPVIEKMVLFWHGLLCSSLEKLHDHRLLFGQNQLFRTYGLGDYPTLLKKVSLDPAMTLYLDNNLNVAGRANENFSRELMELFVTGVDHYTEDDVKESARAWTGHGVDEDEVNYVFDPGAHDWNTKTFMGQTGNFDGPQILDILFQRRRTEHSRFMCQRLWSFFAYPVATTDQVVTDIMATYSPGYNIRNTLRAIFLHPQFRSDRAKNGLVRSPIEYVVAVMRHTSTTCAELHPEWFLPGMGQRPFFPPNVSGWRQNDYWISSAADWSRMHMVGDVRWTAFNRDDIKDVDDYNWDTRTFVFTPEESVDKALWNFKIASVSAASRQNLISFVVSVRTSDHSWMERAGLMFLILMLPEMQLA